MLNDAKDFSVDFLKERAKELDSLYKVDEAMCKDSMSEALVEICRILPKGFCNVRACSVVISLDDKLYTSKPIPEISVNELQSDIIVSGRVRGFIRAIYSDDIINLPITTFLTEEEKLLAAVANKISNRLFHEELAPVGARSNWETILLFL